MLFFLFNDAERRPLHCFSKGIDSSARHDLGKAKARTCFRLTSQGQRPG